METLLWWLEPAERHAPSGRARLFNNLIGFGFGALAGLIVTVLSGPTREWFLSAETSVSVPAHGWQYALWLFVAVAVGWLFRWGTAYRPEVTMRADGIQRIVGKAIFQFYPYAQMQSCELRRVDDASYLLLRINMQPAQPGGPTPSARELTIPARIDAKRVREILLAAGVAVNIS